jgi:hypothetical protein
MEQEKLHAALCPQERLQPPHEFYGPQDAHVQLMHHPDLMQEQESRQQPKKKTKKKKKSFKNAASAAALTQQREAFSAPTSAFELVPEALFRSLTFDSSFV